MAELIFEPYAAHLHWRLPAASHAYPWDRILAEYLEAVAHRCDGHEQSLVGHIKGVATFPGGGYLKLNVVSADQAADVDGAAPERCTELSFALNVLVYGLARENLARIVQDAADGAALKWNGTVEVQPAGAHEHPAHRHD